MAHHRHQHQHIHERDNFWTELAQDAANALDLPGVFAAKGGDESNNGNGDGQRTTVVSVVYVTKSHTGDVIGWRTITTPQPKPTPSPSPTHSSKSALVADTTKQPSKTPKETSTGIPKSIAPPSSTGVGDDSLAVATNSLNLPTTSQPTSSPTASAAAKSGGGMSVGGQAGLAIGIIGIVGALAALAFFFIKKRRNTNADKGDDEKTDVWGGAERSASTRTGPNAPRLSLRPVTQFLPNLAGDKRQSRGNALAMKPAAPAPNHRPNSWEAPMSQQEGNRHNPFGAHAETIDATNARGPAVVEGMSATGEVVAAGAAGAAAGAAAGLTRSASKNNHQKDLTMRNPTLPPISPSGTEFSMSSEAPGAGGQTSGAAAIAAAGGPPNTTVHRVQLDFKPSMDDELELRAGQLIRLLHEYDDGWALCIRLDRSAQGVVPRTCLSVRPVKPRPQPGPGARGPPPPHMRGPPGQPRPMSPGMNQGRPMSPGMGPPQGGRMSPAMNGRMSPAMNQGGRMSPAGGRPASPSQRPQYGPPPNGQGRPRSPSAAQMQDRRNSPPGPSPMNPAANGPSTSPQGSPPMGRKPVPGQAM